jgi:hypothetical protein
MIMRNVTIAATTLETIIEGLESAINVCYNVDSNDGDCKKSYPYAVGYSRGAMEMIRQQLKSLNESI